MFKFDLAVDSQQLLKLQEKLDIKTKKNQAIWKWVQEIAKASICKTLLDNLTEKDQELTIAYSSHKDNNGKPYEISIHLSEDNNTTCMYDRYNNAEYDDEEDFVSTFSDTEFLWAQIQSGAVYRILGKQI